MKINIFKNILNSNPDHFRRDMEQFLRKLVEYQVLIIGLFFSLCIIISASIITNTLSRSGLEVTGSAVQVVKSDSASWNLDITTNAKSMKQAYATLVSNKAVVMSYLKSKGFADSEIEVQNANASPVYKIAEKTGEETNEIEYYTIFQTIKVTSKNIQLIKDASLDAETLLSKGIDVNSNPPSYFYTGLSDLKIQLLKDASEDAKRRARAMLKGSGSSLGPIKSIKTGVFQITTPNSTEVSDYGIYDTTTIDKKVTAVTQVVFRIR